MLELLQCVKYFHDNFCWDDKDLQQLFNHDAFQKTDAFLERHHISTLHDGFVRNLSQRKVINDFYITFSIDSLLIY